MAEEDRWEARLAFEGMALSELDRLVEILNANGDRDLTVLHSVKWTYWCARQVASGGKILVEDSTGKIIEIIFPKIKSD